MKRTARQVNTIYILIKTTVLTAPALKPYSMQTAADQKSDSVSSLDNFHKKKIVSMKNAMLTNIPLHFVKMPGNTVENTEEDNSRNR